MAEQQKRQVAYKVSITDLLKGSYIKEEGWLPNYIKLDDGRQISRVNVVGVVVGTQEGPSTTVVLVDDGTGTIPMRAFDNPQVMDGLVSGDILLIIGRIREYNNQRYLQPEIIRKHTREWFDLRKAELKTPLKKESVPVLEVYRAEEEFIENEPDVIQAIRKLDQGEGAAIQDIITLLNTTDTEQKIERMVKLGEIFENKPGRVKVLE